MRNLLLLTGTALALLIPPAAADEAAKKASGFEAKPLFKASQTADGGALMLPAPDKAEITSAAVTIQPGGHTALHQHPVVSFVYILEGELDVHQGEIVRHYKAGDALIEPINSPMQAFNSGAGVTRMLVVNLGEQGKPSMVAVK